MSFENFAKIEGLSLMLWESDVYASSDTDLASRAFKAGEQSKQGDVDKLISQINEALDAFEDGEFNHCHKTLMKALGDKE